MTICKMLCIGEAWGREESEMLGKCPNNAFVGQAGQLLFEMLGAANPNLKPWLHAEAINLARKGSMRWIEPRDQWLEAASIQYTNVFLMRPPDNKIAEICLTKEELSEDYPAEHKLPITRTPRALYIKPELLHHVDSLHRMIDNLKPNLIVALGNTACWAMLRATNIGSIRGAITQTSHPNINPPIKLLPIYHPAALLHSSMKGQMSKAVSIADFIKAFRECEFPEIRRPIRWATVNPTIEECEAWTAKVKGFATNGGWRDYWNSSFVNFDWLSCDIETAKRMIKCISFAYCDHESLCIPFWPDEHQPYWPSVAIELRAWDCVTELLALPVAKLGQNFIYDLQYLAEAPLGKPIWIKEMEDSMLLHHSWYPEMPKGLGFLASIHSNEAPWKLMRRRRPDSDKRDE